ncbi:hypothetical protein [Burkholderia ubonensis]|uniref:hypothetical protein n=1 Tax=Burkholderia ubonensis TaxID=101571 RepID=UPI000F578002|nr:hypothetical protein [Burkholderia ubonensis]RQP27755.1 hypothetical protein DF155_30870 [Burkholderia ubonensis]RQP29771.1 hypothetical protein DF154_32105 [Burkholderia ubonensis]RQP31927.1 hypothetical protein DF156_31090 [Burkholderia ubonensis]RQP47870.1 hypothetical protein DF144_30795 [Burkholderia ubonensis]RQP50887.1 hypothetical protein DF151_30690 [Burkholderia ubonensis]
MRALLLMVSLCVAAAANAQGDSAQHLLVGDTDVYYGITPAAAVGAHPSSHAESSMHDGVPLSRFRYHLVVALFDHATHERIRDAQVSAAVREIGLGETRKKLEAMAIDGKASYGAYFDLGNAGPYRIKLEINRPNHPGVTSLQFEYRSPR